MYQGVAENIQGGWGKSPFCPSDNHHHYVMNTLLNITSIIMLSLGLSYYIRDRVTADNSR